MKKILLTITLLTLSQFSLACDEACKKTKAETANNLKFATYLTAKYCQQTSNDFLIQGKKSLQTYREKQLPTAHRGGAKNIRNFVLQRKDWLLECDKYLQLTEQGRVFRDKESTDKILGAMTATADELEKIMKRPKNDAEVLDLITAPAGQKFDELFKLVDGHYLELQRRGLL
ncbi:hypothetical protein D0C16_06935 [Cellvibrio sp. KY-GH-1]|uniref:hypothetical protein n=1 Tax=Cellvibrio sp. KY-GH-1 TaxID=2303332 RepID=UPI001244D0D9|nr:hypothetical protein [Cellvibrio sp. KY-GH-1]QEY15726.1 hypothetical protein D0C16_06935 [Cellvibrio sp. KY-GH-1]